MSCKTKKMPSHPNGGSRLSSRETPPSKEHPPPPSSSSSRGSPRKNKDSSPSHHYRRSKRCNPCEEILEVGRQEESPHRRKRTSSSSGVRSQSKHSQVSNNNNHLHISRSSPQRPRRQSEGGEEFLFWKKPDEPQHRATEYRGSPSKIPVPNKPTRYIGQRPSRPKMGVPVMTSTPRLLFGSPPPSSNSKKDEVKPEEEPIYCEIGGESVEGHHKKARSESSDLFYHHNNNSSSGGNKNNSSSLNRNECEGGGKRPSGGGHRQSLADFSLKMNIRNHPLTASPLLSHRQALPSDSGLLGRRAATQFDFFGGGHESHQPPTTTTVLSEYRHGLPPKSIYNHMSGVPYSQPPQRKFIPGLNGINGYCSDNDFSSLANESIASSSLPGQTLRGDISEINVNPGSTLKKGLLWQQRDKLFSRWKERFFILTKDYLQCFRRGSSRISEMGAFIFRIKLIDVEEVELIDKRGYLTISLSMGKEGKVLLRKPDGIRDWFNVLKECVSSCKERRGMMKTSKEFWSKKQFTDSSSMEQYIMARQRIGRQYGYSMESNQSFPFDSNALPTHLRMKMKGSLNPLSSNQHNVSTNNLKHYGYIDVPRSSSTYGNSESDEKGQLQSLCNDLYLKGNVRDYPSEYSHDSGVDSMNTNSSGSVMSGSITSPMMNRPSKFVFKSPDEDSCTQMQGKHLKSNLERDRKISLV